MASWRTPEKTRPRPVSRLTAAPTANSAMRLSPRLTAITRSAAAEQVREDRDRRADGERDERADAAPHRRPELIGIEAELLADERVERRLRVGEDPMRDRRAPLGGKPLDR